MPQSPTTSFSGIFVSYRRDDCSGHAGRLFDNLAKHFGEDQIFMDIDTIQPGEDFVEVIEKAVGSCEIVIAVMGQRWLSSGDGTSRRLDNPNDFVRLEIATALKRNIRVIPVLVQKATMPSPQDLPENIALLSRRHAVELSDSRWQYDVTKLISVMERVLAGQAEKERIRGDGREADRQRREGVTDARPPPRPRSKRTMVLLIIGFISVFAIVALIWRQAREAEQRPTDPLPGIRQTAQTIDATPSTAIPQPPAGMVYVPGGEFMMGRDRADGVDEFEQPAHKITVRPFFIAEYEVTCGDYKKFLDANPDQAAPAGWVNRNYAAGAARKPVTGVNWDQAGAYAAWSGKRLPREEEWEFAARGTDGRLYPWGKDPKPGLANTGKLDRPGNQGAVGMVDVGTYKGKSPFGAYDMVGNAWEWTASDWNAYPGGSVASGLDSSRKVIRGGCWATQNNSATTTLRRGYGARGEAGGYSYTGFRLVKDLTDTSANR